MTQSIPAGASRPPYSSRIIKATALVPDTKVLLQEWDLARSSSENLDRARRANIFGKASRSRIEDILVIFRQRYFADPDIGSALATLVQANAPADWLIPLFYFLSAQNDQTLHDMVVDVLYPRQLSGLSDVPLEFVLRTLRVWIAEGKTTTAWSDDTQIHVAQHILATLRDFGILQGKETKRLAPVYLATAPFALLALWLQNRERSGARVLQSDEWKLFFLSPDGVERLFVEAHQQHLLTYQAAGSVVRIEFPAATLTEYAHALLERARQDTGS